jgi:hypothetical protein
VRLGLVHPSGVRGGERGLDLGSRGRDVRAEQDQVPHLVHERGDGRDEGDRRGGRRGGGRTPNHRLDDLSRVPGDRHVEVDVDAGGTYAVRMEPDIVGAPAELLDSHGADGLAVELPAEQSDLPAREHPFGRLDVLERRLDREQGRHPQVRQEPEERLRPGDRVEPLHAEVLERGERIDHEAGVPLADHLGPQHLLERGDRHLDTRELGALTDPERHLGERNGVAHGRDVLERRPFVAHDVGDRVEHLDPAELGLEASVVDPCLVRGLFERHEKDTLVPTDPFAEELDRERRLPRARWAHDEVRAAGDEASLEHRVEGWVPDGDAGLRRVGGGALLDHGMTPLRPSVCERPSLSMGAWVALSFLG